MYNKDNLYILKARIKGIIKGHKMYKNEIATMHGTTYMVYPNEE